MRGRGASLTMSLMLGVLTMPAYADVSSWAAAVRDELSQPVHPGGVDGRPFWNGNAILFMYPPAFEFKPLGASVGPYRFEVVGSDGKMRIFRAPQPTAALTPVWNDLPEGYTTVVCLGEKGGRPGRGIIVGTRAFWKSAAFTGNYPPPKRPIAEAVRAARAAADWLIANAEPEGRPLAHFPPTYRGTGNKAAQYAGEVMLVYPGLAALAYLQVYGITGEAKYLAEAEAVASTYLRLQGKDGSWALKMRLSDGAVICSNRLVPVTVMMPLFDQLYERTGKVSYRDASARAFANLERTRRRSAGCPVAGDRRGG